MLVQLTTLSSTSPAKFGKLPVPSNRDSSYVIAQFIDKHFGVDDANRYRQDKDLYELIDHRLTNRLIGLSGYDLATGGMLAKWIRRKMRKQNESSERDIVKHQKGGFDKKRYIHKNAHAAPFYVYQTHVFNNPYEMEATVESMKVAFALEEQKTQKLYYNKGLVIKPIKTPGFKAPRMFLARFISNVKCDPGLKDFKGTTLNRLYAYAAGLNIDLTPEPDSIDFKDLAEQLPQT